MQKTEVEAGNVLNSSDSTEKNTRDHGLDIYQAVQRYGLAENDFFDFSSNVNALGPSSAAERAAKRALARMDRYPDMSMSNLRRGISRYYGIKPEQVLCGNGATGLLHLIPRVFKAKKILIPVPTFPEYALAAAGAGAAVVTLPLPERTGFRLDPLEMAFALKGVDMAFLCNPNNPTGLITPKAEMLEIAKYALEQGVRLVVDEAFMEFAASESIVKEAAQAVHLISVRSFSAFFGMPGLRIGYAVSNEDAVYSLREGQEPWPVSIPSEHAAVAALNDWRYTRKTLRLIEKEKARVLSAVRILPGVETFPGAANFIFMKVPMNATLLTEKLALRGLLVRDCSSFAGLDNRFIRITLRTRRENKRLIQALRELLSRQ